MPDQFDPDFPARYRKLPVTVEAIRYTPGTNCIAVAQFLGDDPDDLTCTEEANHQEATYAIATLEGVMHASPGDYIIRGVHGEVYPCRGDIFEATYERADTPVIPGQNPGKPTAETVADALIQYETGGMCHFGKTCGLCDCGRAEQTPERQQEWDAHQLDRARAVLALFPEQRCAPSEDEVANVLRDILVRVFEQDKDIVAQDAARAVLALFADQHTVAQVKAEALREAAEDWMSTDRPATDDAATRWLRNYHGSIDSTALLLAFRAGQKAARPDSETSWIGDHLRARAAAIESGADR